MTDDENLRTRIDELEIKLAHQEVTIEELNDALSQQWQVIDELSRKLVMMGGRLQTLEEGSDTPPPVEPPPPHY